MNFLINFHPMTSKEVAAKKDKENVSNSNDNAQILES